MPLHEYTTVTKKLRRVGRFEWEGARRAAMLNRPTKLAVNFLDYLSFGNRGVPTVESLTPAARLFVSDLEEACGSPAAYLGTGPHLSDTVAHERLPPTASFSVWRPSSDLGLECARE